MTGGPVLVDDTSLCLDALGGMPGPYVKWFAGDGKPADLLVRMLDGFESKDAYALSCVAFSVGPGSVPVVFTGRVDGSIVEPSATESAHSFGWDGAFRPVGANQTFADMPLEEKNKISHRAKALRELATYLSEYRKDVLVRLCDAHAADPAPRPDKFRYVSDPDRRPRPPDV